MTFCTHYSQDKIFLSMRTRSFLNSSLWRTIPSSGSQMFSISQLRVRSMGTCTYHSNILCLKAGRKGSKPTINSLKRKMKSLRNGTNAGISVHLNKYSREGLYFYIRHAKYILVIKSRISSI